MARDEEGKAYTVRYEAVNAMLLNEFLKAHRRIEEQGTRPEKQEAAISKQQQQIEKLTVSLQEVSNEVRLSNPTPKLAANELN